MQVIKMEQSIDFTTITACGECCTGCQKRIDGICKGCIEADGYVPEWAGSGRCKVHECARKHNVQFCGICDEFPCEQLTTIIHWPTTGASVLSHPTGMANSLTNGRRKISPIW